MLALPIKRRHYKLFITSKTVVDKMYAIIVNRKGFQLVRQICYFVTLQSN